MEFVRSEFGIENRDLFYYPKILVYTEGHTDFPFYEEVLQNCNYHLKSRGGKYECKKLVTALVEKDLPYVVVLDGHYEMLKRTRSRHKRIVLLHRHSFENYLAEEEPIDQFCRDHRCSANRLKELANNLRTVFKETQQKFKELIVLDIAHQRAGTGYDVLPEKSDRFFKTQKKVDFLDSQIEQYIAAAKDINRQHINNATILVEKYLRKHRFIDLLPGHFAFGIIRRFILHTMKPKRNIYDDEIRVYLSREVWQLVKTRDHDSLKRRLRRAVREAEKIRQAQSNTNS